MTEQPASTGQPGNVLPREVCVLRYTLERHAQERGDAVYAVFQNGEEWSFRETLRRVRACAAGLTRHGVRQGDRVIIMMPNSPARLAGIVRRELSGRGVGSDQPGAEGQPPRACFRRFRRAIRNRPGQPAQRRHGAERPRADDSLFVRRGAE